MPDLMRLLRSIEAAGFDGAGILDSQMLSRDTFVVLGQAAAATSRLTLFPAVTNPFTRHPSVLAGAIQTVEELAPGRVKFVIGTGYTSASTIGRKPATLAEMRACIGTVGGSDTRSRSLARARLGGGHRGDVVRARRRGRAALRRARARGHAGRLRRAHRRDDEARCASPLPDAAAHVRAAGAGTCRVQGRCIPEARRGGCPPGTLTDARDSAAKGGTMRTVIALVVTVVLGLTLAGAAHALHVGDKAPDFALNGPDGKTVNLTDLTAKGPVVLYTFVAAFTNT